MTRIDSTRRSQVTGTNTAFRPKESAPRAAPTSRDGFETQPVETAGVVPMSRTLRRPSEGADVRQLQEQLRSAGFDPGPIDGKFGGRTESAVRAFQQARGLEVDGVAGRQTYGALGLQLLGQNGTPSRNTPATSETTATTATGRVDERRAIAQRIVRAGGSGTQADVDAVVAQVEKLPLAQLQQLERQGTSIIAARGSVADYRTDLATVQPRGWPPGSTWQQVPGAYAPDRNEVVIGTRTGPGNTRQVPATGQGHGSANIVGHEVGHALDRGAGYPSRTDTAFQEAYRADFDGLSSYLQQPGDAGPSEAYAESLAMYLSSRSQMRRQHPALAAYWDTKFGG